MGKTDIEILEPDMEFDLPLRKNAEGLYMVFPNHIGGKNCLRKLAAVKYTTAYIYLLNIVGTNKYKIGVSSNPQRRFRDIASYLPFELKLLALNKINNAYDFEQSLLDKYNYCLIKSEWFEFTIDMVREIMITLHNREVIENGKEA